MKQNVESFVSNNMCKNTCPNHMFFTCWMYNIRTRGYRFLMYFLTVCNWCTNDAKATCEQTEQALHL